MNKGSQNPDFSFDLDEIFNKNSPYNNSSAPSKQSSCVYKQSSFGSNSYFHNQGPIVHTQAYLPQYPYYQAVSMGYMPLANYQYPQFVNKAYTNPNMMNPNCMPIYFSKKDNDEVTEITQSKDTSKKTKKKTTKKATKSNKIYSISEEEKNEEIIEDFSNNSYVLNKAENHTENTALYQNNKAIIIENPALLELLNQESYQIKKKCLQIQEIIESIYSIQDIKNIFNYLLLQDIDKISIGAYSNYFVQSLIKKLDLEDLKKAWNLLSKFQVMLNEFGNRVVQTLVELMVSHNMQKIVLTKIDEMLTILSFDRYGIFILHQLLKLNLEYSQISFLAEHINEQFNSLVFNINGVVLVKKYFFYLKKNELVEHIRKLYFQRVVPFLYFYMHEKNSSYLILMLIEEFPSIAQNVFDYIDVKILMISEHSAKVLNRLMELIILVSSIY